MLNRYIITASDKILRTDTYLVTLIKCDGTEIPNLEPRRLFPFTNTDKYITLLDEKEQEIAMIKSLDDLESESRKAIEECFFEYYMIPEIKEVLNVEDKFGALKWTVRTDRGNIEFSIRNRHSDIKLIARKRLLVRDSNDNRYHINDISLLDKKSLKKIYSYL